MRLPTVKAKWVVALSITDAVSLAVAAVALAFWGSSSSTPTDAPVVKTAGDVQKLINALPSYAPFSITGVGFYRGQVFVGSNVGLIGVKDSKLLAVYSWDPHDAVVEGPWADEANDSMWIQRVDNGALLRMDQTGWHLVKLPTSPKGYYSRGDVLAGFRGVSDPSGFHLVGGGFVWTWKTSDAWTPEPLPPMPKYSRAEGVSISGSGDILVAQLDTCVLPPCHYAAYWRKANEWGPSITLPMSSMKQVVGTAGEAIVRDKDGSLVRVTRTGAVTLPAPGPVEAVARASNGSLLASVAGNGIFARDGDHWTKLLDYPDGVVPGEHWAYLAEDSGVVAFATASMPQLQNGNNFTYSGGTAVWVSSGTHWTRVTLGEAH